MELTRNLQAYLMAILANVHRKPKFTMLAWCQLFAFIRSAPLIKMHLRFYTSCTIKARNSDLNSWWCKWVQVIRPHNDTDRFCSKVPCSLSSASSAADTGESAVGGKCCSYLGAADVALHAAANRSAGVGAPLGLHA